MAFLTPCSICKKTLGTCICVGCKACFCGADFKDHRGGLLHELDGLSEDSNNLQEKLNKTNENTQLEAPLLSCIDDWQQAAIENIKQTADEARKEVIKFINTKRIEIKNQFEILSKELQQLRETEGFVEQDLTRIKQVIIQMNEDFDNLTNSSAVELHVVQTDQIAWNELLTVKMRKATHIEGPSTQKKSTIHTTTSTPFTIAPFQCDNKPANNTSRSIIGGNTFSTPTSNINLGFNFPASTSTSTGFRYAIPTTTSVSSSGSTTNPPLFNTTSKFNFTNLAKQTFSTKSTGASHGSLIFGTSPTNTNTKDGDEVELYEPNSIFQPIVHLSPVEVKTGEEDENILFCERAKLYRFDAENNQMKERGVGEMKILQHKTTNLCRILMRREQILKLCANHMITPQMELKKHQGTTNAYLWSAMDCTDGEAKHETFCVRFKSTEVAKIFVEQFNKAKQINASKLQEK